MLRGSLARELSSSGEAVARQQGVLQSAMKKEDKALVASFADRRRRCCVAEGSGDCLKKACFYRKVLISFKNKKNLVFFIKLGNSLSSSKVGEMWRKSWEHL